MKLSIIIINYNTFALTCQCIDSVVNQPFTDSYEIILVDNGSSECPVEAFSDKYPFLKLIPSGENLGFAKGNNLGISHAKGEYILLLNSDTIILDNAIQKALKRIHQSPEIGVITCKLLSLDGTIQKQCRRFETLSLTLFEKFRLHKLLPNRLRARILLNGYFDHLEEIRVDRIWGTFFMFRKKDLNSLPHQKLSDKFFMYGEDNEWCYQFKKIIKKQILYYPNAEILHLIGGSKFGDQISPEKNKIINRNRILYLNQYYGNFRTKLMDKIKRI
jgi:GT2 family glycosyltransferase